MTRRKHAFFVAGYLSALQIIFSKCRWIFLKSVFSKSPFHSLWSWAKINLFHNLWCWPKKHFLHDTQGVADSSSATPTILKAASLITYGFLFLLDKWGQCQMLRNTAAQSQRLWNKSYKEANFHSIPPHSTDAPWRQFSKSRPQARLWISSFLRRKPERF